MPASPATAVLLTTLNAKYPHSAFGLRYLYANLKEIQSQARIIEFTTNQNPRDIAETILRLEPKIVGFGVYIWNTTQTHEVVMILKKLRPEIFVVLGGPEVSHETDHQPICQLADLTIRGEADFLFYEFCRDYLASHGSVTSSKWDRKWISGELPDIRAIASPYPYYTDEDIRHRVMYVEASRGCPYKCEYCLSSLDKSVRNFDLDAFLNDMDSLIKRGARQFKFVDRTFNLSLSSSTKILQFFLDRISLGLFLHFEMVPDRLPEQLRDLIKLFSEGALQFEIGIQTWNPEVARRVSRRQDYSKIAGNFDYLVTSTGVHIHADLIAGLPGESLESFGQGFDAVSALKPHEIQVGILKRLKGTPIMRHDQEWGMIYSEQPPFQILQTRTMGFDILQRISRFSKFWDLYANSGNFKNLMSLLAELARHREKPSLFWEFEDFSLFLSQRHPQGNGIALINLVESAWIYLTENKPLVDREEVRAALLQDYTVQVKRDVPAFLKTISMPLVPSGISSKQRRSLPSRQTRHLSS